MRTARQRTIWGRRPAWSSAWWFAPGLALLLVLGSGGDGFAASHSPATNAPSLAPINLNIGFHGVKEPQSADTAIQLLFTLTLERAWTTKESAADAERVLIDLPGVDWREAAAVAELGGRLNEFPAAHAHLVLNAAYETPLLLAQIRAFGALPVTDLVFTHLDEERRWGKLWNFVLGTDYALRFLSAGQNIPGDFFEASAELLLARQFPRTGGRDRAGDPRETRVGSASAK